METGMIESSSREAAAVLLQKYNIFVTSLEQEPEGTAILKIRIEKKISKKDIEVFSRQLAVMLESRVPVIQSLSSLALQTNKEKFKRVILDIAKLVEEGVSLSEAFVRFPKVFDNFYVSLVKSGEISDNISKTLYYIADHLEAEQALISQVRQAMIYPAFTISVLFIVVNIIVIFLLPKVKELIKQSVAKPDAFTATTLKFYDFLESYWWIIVLVFFTLLATVIFYFRTKEGRKVYDKLSLKVPFLGDILRKVFLARFCGNISTLISSGISINKSLKIAADTVNNSVYKAIINDIEKKVSEGEKISSALIQHQDYFPSFVVQMIKVGEETGKLEKTLMEVVVFYQKEIKKAIDLFLVLLEPMLIVFLGFIVGLLAISVFVPLYNTLGNI